MKNLFKKLLRKLGLLDDAPAPERKYPAGQILCSNGDRLLPLRLSSPEGAGMVGWWHEPADDDSNQEELAKMAQDNSSFRAMGIEPHPVCSVRSNGGKIYYYSKG